MTTRATRQGVAAFTLTALVLLVPAGCTAYRAQKSLDPAPDGSEFRNLRVFRSNITRESLIAIMKGYTASLGVTCEHCHLGVSAGNEIVFDFASDAKEEKQIARRMILMTRQLNDEWFEPMGFAASRMSCMTCHRGKTIPVDAPAAGMDPLRASQVLFSGL